MKDERVCPVTQQAARVTGTRSCAACADANRAACASCERARACSGYGWWQCSSCGGWHVDKPQETANTASPPATGVLGKWFRRG